MSKIDKKELDKLLDESSQEELLTPLLAEYQEAKKNYNIAKSIFDKVKDKIKYIADGDNFLIGETKVETVSYPRYSLPEDPMDRRDVYKYLMEAHGEETLLSDMTFSQDIYRSLPDKLTSKLKRKLVKRINIEDPELELKRAKKMEEKRLNDLH